MASFLYFKLRSQISYSTITFDGHFVSVGEAKKLIAAKQGLPESTAEELVLTNAQAGSEYKDDAEQVPKGTSIIVRRVPAGAAHRGSLRALVGATAAPAGASSAQASKPTPTQQQPAVGSTAPADMDEFGGDPLKKQAEALKAQEEAARQAAAAAAAQMRASQVAAATGGRDGPGRGMQHGGRGGRGSRVPYPNYICPRCTAIGKHWESDCPTQNDPAYDVKRVRPPAGLPKGKVTTNPEGDFLLADGSLGQIATNSVAYRAMAAQMLGMPTETEAAAAQTDVLALLAPQDQQTPAIEAGPGQAPSQQAASQPQVGTSQQAAVPHPQLSPQRAANSAQPAASQRQSQPPPSPGPPTASSQLQRPASSLQQPAVSQPSQQQPPLTHQPEQQGQQQPTSTQPAPQPLATAASAVQAAAPTTATAPTPISAPGLFDDDEDVLQAATQQVKLAADASTAAPNEASAAVGPLHTAEPTGSVGTVSKRSASPTLSEGEMQIRAERAAIPTELRKPVFSSVHDFLDRLPLFVDELPAASVKLLVKAFGAGLPLTPTEFKRLQESEQKVQQKADSKAPARSSRLGHDREGGSARDRDRGRGRSREDGSRRGHRSRSQSRSRSPRARSRSRGRSHRICNEDAPPTMHVSRSNRDSKDGKGRAAEHSKDSSKAAVRDSKPASKDSSMAKDSKTGKTQVKQAPRDSKAAAGDGIKAASKPPGLPTTSNKGATASKEARATAHQEEDASRALSPNRDSHGSMQQPVNIEEAKQGGGTEQQAQGDGVAVQRGAVASTGREPGASSQARSHDVADEKEAERSSSQHDAGSLAQPDAQPVSSGASRGSPSDEEMPVASAHDAPAVDEDAAVSGGEASQGEDTDGEKVTPQKRKSSSKSHEDRKHKKQKKSKKHKEKEKDRTKDKKDVSKRKHRSQRASRERSHSPDAPTSDQDQAEKRHSRSRSRSHSRSRKRTRSPSPEQVRGRKATHDRKASPSRSPRRSPPAASRAAMERPASRARSPVKAPRHVVAAPRRQAAADLERPAAKTAIPSRLAGRLARQSLQEALQPSSGDAARKRRPETGALPIHGRMGASSDEEEEPARTGKDGRWLHDKFGDQKGSSDGSARVKRLRG